LTQLGDILLSVNDEIRYAYFSVFDKTLSILQKHYTTTVVNFHHDVVFKRS